MIEVLTAEEMEGIRRLDTCSVANAIETFNRQLRNEGFANASVRCMLPRSDAMLGYAVTAKVRCSSPPPDGLVYPDRTEWWSYILSIPAPRVVVVQDLDDIPGVGAIWGEVHSSILLALGCVGAVTNGAVRDLPAVRKTPFHFFAGSVSVSHAYTHIVEIGGPVEVGGLKLNPGALIHGDCHGILSIPREIARELPAVAARIKEHERTITSLCGSKDFSLDRLRTAVNTDIEMFVR